MAFRKRDDGDPRIKTLADSLCKAGIQRPFCRVMAYGFARALWELTWTSFNDLLGKADELEIKLEWFGPPRTLTKGFLNAGMLVEENGELVNVLAFQEAPEYVRKRWRRNSPMTYDSSAERCKRLQTKPVEIIIDPVEPEKPTNLFGEATPLDPSLRKAASSNGTDSAKYTPGHRDLVAFWTERWGDKYGSKYPFRPVDAKHIKTVLEACSGFEHAQGTLLSFLGDSDRFLKGHSLNRLVSNLAKYTAQPNGKRAGEFAEPERDHEAIDPDSILAPDPGATDLFG